MRDHFEGFNTVTSQLDLPAMLFEHIADDTANAGAIIDDKDMFAMLRFGGV
jgi:hypothetical protein